MKNKRLLFLFITLLTLAQGAWADDPEWLKSGDSWDEATKTLTVNSNPANNAYQNRSDIEHVIVSDNVESIGNNAFYDCNNLKTVFVGNGVESIGNCAFSSTSLTTVIISRTSSAPSINGIPFPPNLDLKIYVPMDSNGNIPDDYKSGNWGIYNSNHMLVASKKSGTCAIAYNNHVLTVVGCGAMADSGIESLMVFDYQAAKVTSLVIEDGVTHIGGNAFSGCSNLPSINISANVQSIGSGAFSGCSSLATITVDEDNQTFDSRGDCNAIIRKEGNELVAGCKNTTIPEDVQSIGERAFSGCGSLTSITIPASVTSIGEYAFESCGLTAITIPDNVQSIGVDAFYRCSNLESVSIGSGVESISPNTFNRCHNLRTITVDANNQTFDSRDGCNAIIRKSDDELVVGCYATIIPNSVKSIGDMAFMQTALQAITIPASVQSIGSTAFLSCSNLKTVTIYATSVPTLGASAFGYNYNDRNPKIYVFSDRVEAYKAAWGMNDDIKAIGGTCGKTNNDNVTWELAGELGNCTLIISGTGAMADYSAGYQPWAAYNAGITKVIIGSGVTEVSSSAFIGCENLTTVTIADGLCLYNGTEILSGDITDMSKLNGKTLKVAIPYIDADGNTAYCTDFTVIDGSVNEFSAPGWYVVNSDVNMYYLNFNLYESGAVNLLICDGATLNVGDGDDYYDIYFDGSSFENNTLAIYGQTVGSGTIYANNIELLNNNSNTNNNLDINGGTINANLYLYTKEKIEPDCGITIRRGTVTSSGIYANNGDITISGGTVTVNSTDYNAIGTNGNITISGGTVTVETSGYSYGIYADYITISGGRVTATTPVSDNYYGMWAGRNITLGWTNATDFIKASSYYVNYNLAVADNKMMSNGTEVLSGTVYDDYNQIDNLSKLNGKTLIGVDVLLDDDENDIAALATRLDGKQTNVVLAGRTLYKDGDWNTLCLPFSLASLTGTPLEGATVKELDVDGTYDTDKKTGFDDGTLYLYFKDATAIEAGKPYLVKWDKAADYDDDPSKYDITAPVFTGVTISSTTSGSVNSEGNLVQFKGIYNPTEIYSAANDNLFLGAGNNLYWPSTEGYTLNAFRAYFHVALSGEQHVREIRMNLGDEVTDVQSVLEQVKRQSRASGKRLAVSEAGAWFDLFGRKLNGKPTQKGMYIHDGKAIVVNY